MWPCIQRWRLWQAAVLAVLLAAGGVSQAADPLAVKTIYLQRAEEPFVPLSLLDLPIEDDGVRGAELALRDNQTTGRFLGHEYTMDVVTVAPEDDLAAVVDRLVADGPASIVADLNREDLLVAADHAPNSLIFNIRASDDSLRNADCRANLLHVLPSRAMLTDALAQYLAWKRWQRVFLVMGQHPEDQAWADAFRRAAKRFGLKIVDEKTWTSKAGARRTDSGHHSLQSEVPAFTQAKDHDIVVVADERDEFGEYLLFHTTRPRPVAGTHGLVTTAWHRTQEQWGATQIQRRFEKLAGRWMSPRDYAAWASLRVLGEAVTRTGAADVRTLEAFILSDDFNLAAFKGLPLDFRRWNGQLRQPILLAGPRMLVSVSPQSGFLHEHSELDTLGYDRPESDCEAFPDE